MEPYRPLPTPPARPLGQPAYDRAHALLLWVMEHNILATLSDLELDLVEMAATIAAVQLPAKLEGSDVHFSARLSAIRHHVALVKRAVANTPKAHAAHPATPASFPVGGSQDGRPAPLAPVTPKLPPAPAFAMPVRVGGGEGF